MQFLNCKTDFIYYPIQFYKLILNHKDMYVRNNAKAITFSGISIAKEIDAKLNTEERRCFHQDGIC